MNHQGCWLQESHLGLAAANSYLTEREVRKSHWMIIRCSWKKLLHENPTFGRLKKGFRFPGTCFQISSKSFQLGTKKTSGLKFQDWPAEFSDRVVLGEDEPQKYQPSLWNIQAALGEMLILLWLSLFLYMIVPSAKGGLFIILKFVDIVSITIITIMFLC